MGADDSMAGLFELRCEALRLRGLAAALSSFERNEESHGPTAAP